MKYREYGKTGKKVSLLGFGGMRFTEDREESLNAVKRAAELGVNYFDTAPTYCNSTSEEIIGEALEQMKNKKVYISTKSSMMADRTSDDVLKRVEISLKRLRVDKIDFYNMWCIMNREHFERIIAKGGPYDGAVKAKKMGLVEHLAFSTHASGKEISEMCAAGLFEGVTLGYNIINHEFRETALKGAAKNNMGVVTMNPIGGGLLTRAYDMFDFIGDDYQNKHIAGALRFNAAHKEITCVLSGMGKVKEVEENVRILENFEKPSEEYINKVKEVYGNLGEQFCTACNYCMPCPQGINIQCYMRAFDLYKMKRQDIGEGIITFFKNAAEEWVTSDNCIECGECEEKCTQHLQIIEAMKTVSRVYGR